MALVLVSDTETTGLNVREDYILELGSVIYDTDDKQIYSPFSELILWPARPIITPKIEKLTGISQKAVEKWGKAPEEVLGRWLQMAARCDYICFHNGILYDFQITETNILRLYDPDNSIKRRFYALKLIDTLVDLPYREEIGSRKLKYCALDHGYIMTEAHRALPDVLATTHLLKCYPWEQILEIIATPLQYQYVKIDWNDKEKQEEAKSNGFHWNKPRKSWERFERKYFTDKRTAQLSFKESILTEPYSNTIKDVTTQNSQGELLPLTPLPQTSTQAHTPC